MRNNPCPIPEALTGYHERLAESAYRQDPSLNISELLRWVAGAPPKPDSEALSFGRIFHTLALTPSERLDQVVDMRAFRKAQAMAEAFHARPDVAELVARAYPEVSLFWDDADTGIACKARLDLLAQGVVADLKSTWSLDAFLDDAERYNYYRQAAWYLWAANSIPSLTAGGQRFDRFVLIAVEKDAPHDVDFFEVSQLELSKAHRQNMADLRRYRDAAIGGAV